MAQAHSSDIQAHDANVYFVPSSSRWPVVAEQLRKAGVRLAAVLERALGSGSPRPRSAVF